MTTASPFSFHCIVCFEEFGQEERYPVVLPCGHTYVCNECANRLDKCMECRTSLAMMLPVQTSLLQRSPAQGFAAGAHGHTGWSSVRSGGRGSVLQPRSMYSASRTPPVTRRLPLPKNVVLLSLMEATALTVKDLSPSPYPLQQSVSLDDYDAEEEQIKLGTSIAIGACGTYIVAAHENIHIFPSRPTSTMSIPYESSGSDSDVSEGEDVDTLVSFFHKEQHVDVSLGRTCLDSKDSKPLSPVDLKHGDRVQIVLIEDGWAKLARGYGYIQADTGQIIKVGGSIDRSCKLEAMLKYFADHRKSMQKDQMELESQFVTLVRDLQNSLVQDEDLTVIGADTFKDIDKKIVHLDLQEQENELDNHTEPDNLFKPYILVRQTTPPSVQEGVLGCFTVPYVCDAFEGLSQRHAPPQLDVTARNDREDDMIANLIGACSHGDENSINSLDRVAWSIGDDSESVDCTRMDRRAHFQPSPCALSAGAKAWREQNGREPSNCIDFRTGRSGHLALTSSHAQLHDGSERNQNTRKMSSHLGLRPWGPSRRFAQPSNAPIMPSHSPAPCSNEGQEECKDDVSDDQSVHLEHL